MSYSVTSEDWTTLPTSLLPVVKQQCRVDFTDDDAILTRHIQWAVSYCQSFTGLQIFEAEVTWTPGNACSRYQCPAQPVSAFTVSSATVDVSADYALQSGALTAPVWLVHSDGTSFATDTEVTLTAGYADADLIPPNLYGNILRVAATLYENRESISAISLDQMPFWLNDMMTGLWVPQGMNRQARPALIAVDNPYYSADHPESRDNPRTVEAVVNLREWSVATLAAHGVLDADQVAAAFRFRNAWETVQGARQASIGFSEWIDAGCRPPGFSERRLAAAGTLRQCRRLLGAHGYRLVAKICGDGYHIRDLYATRRQRDTATDLLKLHLTQLAALWH